MLAALWLALIPLGLTHANQDVVRQHIPDAEIAGKGRLAILFLDMYDATLHAPDGKWQPDAPYALTLDYLRDFKGADIAKTSADEMARLGQVDGARIASWRQQMAELFPDVDDRSQITGVRDEGGGAIFYLGDELLGTVEDPLFGELFFGIWLDERTRVPGLRAKLLGLPR